MIMKLAMAGLLATTVMAVVPAQAETLRLLTWGSYAPDELVKKFEEKYPDITVEVTMASRPTPRSTAKSMRFHTSGARPA